MPLKRYLFLSSLDGSDKYRIHVLRWESKSFFSLKVYGYAWDGLSILMSFWGLTEGGNPLSLMGGEGPSFALVSDSIER